jgi:cysteine desulfurase
MEINEEMIYWDNAATTKVDQRVLDAMLPYFTHYYGNASSNHQFGKIAKDAIEKARGQVAKLINAEEKEIIFTSGATESINMALKGYVEANYQKGNHIITVKTEHKAVLATCEYLEERGIEVTYLGVDNNGLISLEELEDAIKPSTLLISIMYVNNEIGVIQPISEIGKIAKKHSIAFFCDATQAIGKLNVDVFQDNIDMLAFSSHKIYGPKGIGVLYKRNHISIKPIIHGGNQEFGLRAGTINTPLIVGIGQASLLAKNEIQTRNKSITKKRNDAIEYFIKNNIGILPPWEKFQIPNILNIELTSINSVDFINTQIENMAISNGSACNSGIFEISYVFSLLSNYPENIIRISF